MEGRAFVRSTRADRSDALRGKFAMLEEVRDTDQLTRLHSALEAVSDASSSLLTRSVPHFF